jgi:hypothetical protein
MPISYVVVNIDPFALSLSKSERRLAGFCKRFVRRRARHERAGGSPVSRASFPVRSEFVEACSELVEGRMVTVQATTSGSCFDKLSTNGFVSTFTLFPVRPEPVEACPERSRRG